MTVVSGSLPPNLLGAYVRNGPNPRLPPRRGYHWFDGDGMVHCVRFHGDRASYANHWIRTNRIQDEADLGAAHYQKIGDFDGATGLLEMASYELKAKTGMLKTRDAEGRSTIGTANTSLVWHGGSLLALNEGDFPYKLAITADGRVVSRGITDFAGQLKHPCTAHPKIDPRTAELMFFAYDITKKPHVQYAVVSPDLRLNSIDVGVSQGTMMHDFACSATRTVFMEQPLVVKPELLMPWNAQVPLVLDEEQSSRYGVLPRHATSADDVVWFEGLPSCYVFHVVNCWDEGDEVVMWACRMSHFALQLDPAALKSRLCCWRFNTRTGEATETIVDTPEFQGVLDFPQINPAFAGRPTQFAWLSYFEPGYTLGIVGVIKVDLFDNAKVVGSFAWGEGVFGSEAMFATPAPLSKDAWWPSSSPPPSSEPLAEDDGWLVAFVHDTVSDVSQLRVMDATKMDSAPVVALQCPARVPFGFHAAWVSEGQLATQPDQARVSRL